jgi:hypothetical protein
VAVAVGTRTRVASTGGWALIAVIWGMLMLMLGEGPTRCSSA